MIERHKVKIMAQSINDGRGLRSAFILPFFPEGFLSNIRQVGHHGKLK
jgi:hypothetical protein